MITISVAQLRSWGACVDGLEDFREVYGDEPVPVTVRLLRAMIEDYDWPAYVRWGVKQYVERLGRADQRRIIQALILAIAPRIERNERDTVSAHRGSHAPLADALARVGVLLRHEEGWKEIERTLTDWRLDGATVLTEDFVSLIIDRDEPPARWLSNVLDDYFREELPLEPVLSALGAALGLPDGDTVEEGQ